MLLSEHLNSLAAVIPSRYKKNNEEAVLKSFNKLLREVPLELVDSKESVSFIQSALSLDYPNLFRVIEDVVPADLLEEVLNAPHPSLPHQGGWLHWATLRNDSRLASWLLSKNNEISYDNLGRSPVFEISSTKMVKVFENSFSKEIWSEVDFEGVRVFQNWMDKNQNQSSVVLDFFVSNTDLLKEENLEDVLRALAYQLLLRKVYDKHAKIIKFVEPAFFDKEIDLGGEVPVSVAELLAKTTLSISLKNHLGDSEKNFNVAGIYQTLPGFYAFFNMPWTKSDNMLIQVAGTILALNGAPSSNFDRFSSLPSKYKGNLKGLIEDVATIRNEFREDFVEDTYFFDYKMNEILNSSLICSFFCLNGGSIKGIEKLDHSKLEKGAIFHRFFELENIPFVDLVEDVNKVRTASFLNDEGYLNTYYTKQLFSENTDAILDFIKTDLAHANSYSWMVDTKRSVLGSNYVDNLAGNAAVDYMFGSLLITIQRVILDKLESNVLLSDKELMFLNQADLVDGSLLSEFKNVDSIKTQEVLKRNLSPNTPTLKKDRF